MTNDTSTDFTEAVIETENLDAVPIEELEALADEWEDGNGRAYTTAQALCAEELREVLETYE